MHLPPDTSTAARIAEIERQLADLRQTGSRVYNSSTGLFVPLSSLAFGQVTALRAGVGVVSLTGVAATSKPGSTLVLADWTIGAPEVDVLVTGGRLRVDWASLLAVTGSSARMVMSTTLIYTGPPDAPGTMSTSVVPPEYYRSLFPFAAGSNNAAMINAGTFSFHTGLTPGWYKVRSAFALAYESTTAAPLGSADNPRIGATPY